MTKLGQEFHITVGTTPASKLNLYPELGLLKAALLYADKVKFCSISSTLILSLLVGFEKMSEEDLWTLVKAQGDEELNSAIEIFETLKTKKHRSKKELVAYQKVKSKAKTVLSELRHGIKKSSIEAGLDGLLDAINSGLVELQTFTGSDTKVWVNEYFDVVGQAVLAKETYPLFDDRTGQLISYALREGKLSPSPLSVNKAKQVGLSSDLLSKLPLFDRVSIKEILDIRAELKKPLTNFRSAIISYSAEIENAAWDKEFSVETEQIFRKYVEPSVLEIEEAYKSNKLLSRLIPNYFTEGSVPSFLGVILDKAANLPELTVLGLGAGATLATLKTVREWREKNEAMERNQLYFYYKAGKMINN